MDEIIEQEERTLKKHIRMGIEQGIIALIDGSVHYLYQQKKYPIGPEETVRLLAYLSLIFDKSYKPECIDLEKSVRIGSSNKRLDISVYRDSGKSELEILVECKRSGTDNKSLLGAIEQAKSYCHFVPTRYVCVCTGEFNLYFRANWKGNQIVLTEVPELPKLSGDVLSKYLFKISEWWFVRQKKGKQDQLLEQNKRFSEEVERERKLRSMMNRLFGDKI